MTQQNIKTEYIEHHEKYLLGYISDPEDLNFTITGPDTNIKTPDFAQIYEIWEILRKKKPQRKKEQKNWDSLRGILF